MARWKPKRQETYYFINEYLKVKSYYWWEEQEDNKLYDVGNCFKTKEEAERALEKVKELLLSLHEEVKANGTRKDYIDMLKHYATIGAKGVKTETLVKVVELMTKDVTGEQ